MWRETWKDDYRRQAEALQEIRKGKPRPKITLVRKPR